MTRTTRLSTLLALPSLLALFLGGPVWAKEMPLRQALDSFESSLGQTILIANGTRNQTVDVVEGLEPAEAFDLMTQQFALYAIPAGEDLLLVSDDTPQNRRRWESQSIRTFFLEHARLPAMMTMLRSLIGLKVVAADERLNAFVLRDSEAKIRIAERIVETQDRPAPMVDLRVDVLMIPGDALPSSPRLSPDEVDRLRSDRRTRILGSPTLALTHSSEASFSLPVEAGLLTFEAEGGSRTGEVASLSIELGIRNGEGLLGSWSSEVELDGEHGWLVHGLDGSERAETGLAVLLTPTIRGALAVPNELLHLAVGTESSIRLDEP